MVSIEKVATTAPPAAVVCANWAGITLPEAVQLASFIWVLILIGEKLVQFYQRWKKGRVVDNGTD